VADARVMGHTDANVTEPVDASAPRDATSNNGGPTDLDASGPRRDAAIEELPPFPLDGLNTLQDPCCYTPQCYAIAGSCPELDVWEDPHAEFAPECERRGPFTPNPAYPYDLYPDVDANCCYIGPAVCFPGDGRPFTTDGVDQVAPVITRSDWLLG
jgi:hypothetical protein